MTSSVLGPPGRQGSLSEPARSALSVQRLRKHGSARGPRAGQSSRRAGPATSGRGFTPHAGPAPEAAHRAPGERARAPPGAVSTPIREARRPRGREPHVASQEPGRGPRPRAVPAEGGGRSHRTPPTQTCRPALGHALPELPAPGRDRLQLPLSTRTGRAPFGPRGHVGVRGQARARPGSWFPFRASSMEQTCRFPYALLRGPRGRVRLGSNRQCPAFPSVAAPTSAPRAVPVARPSPGYRGSDKQPSVAGWLRTSSLSVQGGAFLPSFPARKELPLSNLRNYHVTFLSLFFFCHVVY